MTASGFRYRAFISYSHRDQTVARWLHGALESYRVPKRLVGKETATGAIAPRLGAIFRDRDELPVASDLSGKINDALAATQFLIVLCSTASAQSKWVNQEVINFKRLKGEDSIIAVILDGEPFASNLQGRDAKECFVPALRFRVAADGALSDQPAEPIAADLRPDKDSRRLVKLKVIAGLLGLGLDEIVRRENQRRTQRLFWLSAGMAAAMVVMGVLTVTAIQSRNEAVSARNDAERQKTQAEDLIEFMLGDLRKKLEPVGRLDVLDSVGDRALRYFATLKPNELDADTLGRRARTLHMLGELEDLRGNLDKARAVFAEANESTDALLAQNSADPQRLFDHSQSIYWLGYIDWRRGEKKSAKKAFDQYRSMAEQLASVDPGNPRWRREQAYAYSNVGSLLFQGHEFSRARQSFEAALKVLTELAAQQPEDQLLQLDCARATSWLADSLKQVGLLDSARVQTMNELAIYERILAKDPLNSMVWENAVLSKLALARLDVEEGHLDRALVRLSDAEQGAQRLVKIEPENAAWLELSTKVQVETGETYLLTEQIGKAHEYISNALKLSESLFKQSPDVLDWQLSIMIRSNVLLARIYEKENKGKYAMGLLSSSINVLDKMKGVRADDSSIMWLKAQVLLVKGDVLMSLRDSKNARESWLLGLEEISAIANEATPSERIVQINLGQRSGAFPRDELLSMVQKLLAMGIRHPDLKLAMGRLILSKQ